MNYRIFNLCMWSFCMCVHIQGNSLYSLIWKTSVESVLEKSWGVQSLAWICCHPFMWWPCLIVLNLAFEGKCSCSTQLTLLIHAGQGATDPTPKVLFLQGQCKLNKADLWLESLPLNSVAPNKRLQQSGPTPKAHFCPRSVQAKLKSYIWTAYLCPQWCWERDYQSLTQHQKVTFLQGQSKLNKADLQLKSSPLPALDSLVLDKGLSWSDTPPQAHLPPKSGHATLK